MADDKKPAPGTNQRDTTTGPGNQDTQVAEAAGITEGEVKRLRYEADLNKSAGHEANIHAWEASQAGQEWLATEDDRQKQIEDERKEAEESANQTDEKVERYRNAVEEGRKAASKRAKADR